MRSSSSSLPRRDRLAQPVGVFALGGYGRRQLCLHSDIDLLILFAGPIGAADERFLHAFLNPLWDLGPDHRAPRARGRRRRRPRRRQPGVPARADRRAGGRRRRDAARSVLRRGHRGPRTATRTLDALKALIAERHARFNDTLYQLEPDVKEAPGGLRDLFGAQTIAKLTDPALLGRGRLRAARARRRRGVPAARALDAAPRGEAAPQRARATSCRSAWPSVSATRARRRGSASSA